MIEARPLQNRGDPFGELHATAARGLFMGNRGGRFHRDDRTLGASRWSSRRWIICRLQFQGRRRDVWGRSYTELFFLDEPTALAAGHRPCFECRREAALAFCDAISADTRIRANAMDARLHAERLEGSSKRRHRLQCESLPDGAMIAVERRAYAVRGDSLWPWNFLGYGAPQRRPRGIVEVLTPPIALGALLAGYRVRWASGVQDPNRVDVNPATDGS